MTSHHAMFVLNVTSEKKPEWKLFWVSYDTLFGTERQIMHSCLFYCFSNNWQIEVQRVSFSNWFAAIPFKTLKESVKNRVLQHEGKISRNTNTSASCTSSFSVDSRMRGGLPITSQAAVPYATDFIVSEHPKTLKQLSGDARGRQRDLFREFTGHNPIACKYFHFSILITILWKY